jgi:uncharacterized protein (UPF0276 family)
MLGRPREKARVIVERHIAAADPADEPGLLRIVLRDGVPILELGEIRETDFISRAVEESGSGFLLDIPSAVTTADRAGYALEDYVLEMPLHRLIEVHVGDVESEWDLLELVVQRSRMRAVTLEANLAEVSISHLRDRAVEIRQLLASTQSAAFRREKPASP